jgi:hypothetical protein
MSEARKPCRQRYTPPGAIPDDLSLTWYLHYVLGQRLTPTIASEIVVRANFKTGANQ